MPITSRAGTENQAAFFNAWEVNDAQETRENIATNDSKHDGNQTSEALEAHLEDQSHYQSEDGNTEVS